MHCWWAYDPEAAWKREDDGKNHGEIDAAIAVTQMMLQAADLGLGTTYVGMFDPEKLHAAFPELAGLTPIALLPMGYPAEGAHPSRLHTDAQAPGGAGAVSVTPKKTPRLSRKPRCSVCVDKVADSPRR